MTDDAASRGLLAEPEAILKGESGYLFQRLDELEGERRLAAVVQLSQYLAQEHDPGELLHQVCRSAREMTSAADATVELLAEDGATTVVAAVSHSPGEAETRTAPDSHRQPSGMGPVLGARRALRLSNPGGRAETIGFAPEAGDVFSYLSVPMVTSLRVYGWIGVRNRIGSDEFTVVDEQALTMLGVHAGIAFENARLVAELRRQSAVLRTNQEQLHFALESAEVGIWELRLRDGRLKWSDSMSTVFGVPPDRFPSTLEAFAPFVHVEDWARVQAAADDAIRGKDVFRIEHRTLWPDGSVHWAAARGRIVCDAEGEPVTLVGVAGDVTERKQLEEQLGQSQKVEAVGQLAGGIAHDFNNLLTVIMGYSNFLMEGLQATQHAGDLEQIIIASERAAQLTNQLLAFSRKQMMQLKLVDLNELVTGITTMLSRLIGEHIRVETELSSTPSLVLADPGQIGQVIVNLAVNARDAMPGGGVLTIQTAHAEGPARLDDPRAAGTSSVRLALIDTGTGMDAATQQRLFEPFFTTKEVGRGTGLGLATVYGIVRQSGGRIDVTSELGQGTTFALHFPAALAEAGIESNVEPRTAAAHGAETILLVEDDESVRQLVRTILERAGYRVIHASDAHEALERFEQQPVDLVVTDVIMPGESGLNLYRRLAADHAGLRVLYASGYTDDVIVDLTHLPTEAAFIRKPFSAAEIVTKVREVLDR